MSAGEWLARRGCKIIPGEGGALPMMLCSVPGFLPAIRAAIRARPDIPRAAFVRAARHEHASFTAHRAPLTADEVLGIAQHFHCVAWLKGRVRNA